MGLLGRLLGSEKALEGAVAGVTKGLDALFYTEEEKAEDGKKERAAARAITVEWMKNSQGQNLSRRVLAFMITTTWLSAFIGSFAVDVAVVFASDPAKLVQVSELLTERLGQITGAVMLILTFYFAAPHIGAAIGPALASFSKRKEA